MFDRFYTDEHLLFVYCLLFVGRYLFKFNRPEASDPDKRSDDVSKDGTQQLKLLTCHPLKHHHYWPVSFQLDGKVIVVEVGRLLVRFPKSLAFGSGFGNRLEGSPPQLPEQNIYVLNLI